MEKLNEIWIVVKWNKISSMNINYLEFPSSAFPKTSIFLFIADRIIVLWTKHLHTFIGFYSKKKFQSKKMMKKKILTTNERRKPEEM